MSTLNQKREYYNKTFLEAKSTLNEKQAIAVDQIYGPVMTVAGPGTGKTQLLAVRIGNILQQTDVNTKNILALTFTEAGSMAMRDRLKKFIGPEAYNANIFTFHGFCNYVIQENIQYFGGYRNLQAVSDLELVDVYREIIDQFPEGHPLKRYKGDIYYDRGRLRSLFNTMKQEGWSASYIKDKVDALWDYYHEQDENGEYIHPKFLCKRKQTGKKSGKVYPPGSINDDKVEAEIAKFDPLLAGTLELDTYNRILERMERYDYNDMILWVIKAFKEHDELLAKYQERFQFLLVDEYQDTNGAQNELLFLLADNPVDDRPNVFIVGDDDQSIYRFQGANMNNIIDFANKYNPLEIVLDNNYRSYQGILDKSKQLIENNGERLINVRDHLTKNLVESRQNPNSTESQPRVWRFKNRSQEELGVIQDILRKHESGVPLNQMAIIYRKHKNVGNIVKYLTLKGIPLNIKKKVDVLKQIEINRLTAILKYITGEYNKPYSGEHMLFSIMHFDYFGIRPKDIALLSIYCSKRTDSPDDDRRWRSVITNVESLKAAGIEDVEPIIRFGDVMERWIGDIPNVTAQVLFERILTYGGIMDDILRSEDKVWRLQMVNTFFNFIKDESTKGDQLSMVEILSMVEKMEDNRIEMPLARVIFSEHGIHFLTAHGSKGLEFEHVYIIGSDSSNWVEKNYGRGSFKYPPSLVPATDKSDVEDDRRLFYVAMTRAQNDLTISFADFDDNEKALQSTRFIDEIVDKEEDVLQMQVKDEDVLEYSASLMMNLQGKTQLIEPDLIDRVLQTFKVSATSLNKYLRCPITFYFENILRVPMARSATNGFGNAIHYALELFFRDLEADAERRVPAEDILLAHFYKGMKIFHSHFTKKEYELSEMRGKTLLHEYYEEYNGYWSLPRKYELEFDIKTESAGVPISGKIDRVEIYDDQLQVVDYKTGRYDSKKLKGPTGGDEDLGGDYWRQIVFYNLLLDGDDRLNKRMAKGVMDFVEKNKDGNFKRVDFEVEEFEKDFVKDQLVDTYTKIKNHEFQEGCGEENCRWCTFVAENMGE